MSQTLTLELSDESFETIEQIAAAAGQPTAAWAVAILEGSLPRRNGQANGQTNGPMHEQPAALPDERTLAEKYEAAKARFDPEFVAMLTRVALHHGLSPEEYIVGWDERNPPGPPPGVTQEAWEEGDQRLRQFCGIFNGGDPNSADNERIDADLAREYADNHEDEA